MNMKYIYISLVSIVVLLLSGCDAWDDHNKIDNERESHDIVEVINSKSELSKFAEALKKTGYDKILQEAKMYTVFAPDNNAMGSVDLNDTEALLVLVKNHIAYASHTLVDGVFQSGRIEMVNKKLLNTSGATIGGSSLKESNITTSNGILHVLDQPIVFKLNIMEYLQRQSGYEQIEVIKSFETKIMDMDKSVQIGVNEMGRPIYDTVWVRENKFLDQYQLEDEKKTFTYVLLDQAALDKLKEKYTKYFKRPTQTSQDSLIINELTKDLILNYVSISAAGAYNSVDGVKVNINPVNVTETYEASNGNVYKLSDADIKIYENKIKTILIEAENYYSKYAGADSWSVRYRSWASGGQDIMLNSVTRDTVQVVDSITGLLVTKTFNYTYNSSLQDKTPHAYLEYRLPLHSVGYKIYTVAYDDLTWHYEGFTDTDQRPMPLEQKIFFSFPDNPRLRRNNTSRRIENNFDRASVFVIKSTAGIHSESQGLRMQVRSNPENITPYYIPDAPFAGSDTFGTEEEIICPSYGETTIFVTNTPRLFSTNTNELDTYPGMMFLDYIKLVPVVAPND